MDYSISLPGFGGRQPVLRTRWLRGPLLLQDGVPATKAATRGSFILRRNDGSSASARIVQRAFGFDPVPDVDIDGQRITLVPPLRWWQWLICGFPLVLVAVGGALGGLIGAAGMYVNVAILRSDLSPALRYLFVGVTTASALAGFVLLRAIVFVALGR